MTTPSTAQVREWTRSQGIEVADRGRLPDELRAAYLKAGVSGSRTLNKTAPKAVSSRPPSGASVGRAGAVPTQATASPATTVTGPPPERLVVQPPVPRRTGGRPAPRSATRAMPAASSVEAEPTVAPPADAGSPARDARLDQLEARVAALVERVAALEGGSAKAKSSLFRRRQS